MTVEDLKKLLKQVDDEKQKMKKRRKYNKN